MTQSISRLQPPLAPLWDITFTRLHHEVRRSIDICHRELANLFQAAGLDCTRNQCLTPYGISTFLDVSGHDGRLFRLQYCLVDGLFAADLPGAVLECRLTDTDDVLVTHLSPIRTSRQTGLHTAAARIVSAAGDALNTTAVYETVVRHFDLVFECARS